MIPISLKEKIDEIPDDSLREKFLKEAEWSYAADMMRMGPLPKAGILCAGLGLEKPFVLYLLVRSGAIEKDPCRYFLPPEHGVGLFVDYALGAAAKKLLMYHLRKGVAGMGCAELEQRLADEDYTLPESSDAHLYKEHCGSCNRADTGECCGGGHHEH
ncbi:hypothetical protein KY362_02305 [Candidatus Woesearchaeota archaeon]|nr:hypothetical protein [Candidatus Woesearchaeota archaeon]